MTNDSKEIEKKYAQKLAYFQALVERNAELERRVRELEAENRNLYGNYETLHLKN